MLTGKDGSPVQTWVQQTRQRASSLALVWADDVLMARSLTSVRVGPDSDPDRYLLLRPLPGPIEHVVRYRGHDTSSGAPVDVYRVDDSELHRPAIDVEGRVRLVQSFEGSVGHGVGRFAEPDGWSQTPWMVHHYDAG